MGLSGNPIAVKLITMWVLLCIDNAMIHSKGDLILCVYHTTENLVRLSRTYTANTMLPRVLLTPNSLQFLFAHFTWNASIEDKAVEEEEELQSVNPNHLLSGFDRMARFCFHLEYKNETMKKKRQQLKKLIYIHIFKHSKFGEKNDTHTPSEQEE